VGHRPLSPAVLNGEPEPARVRLETDTLYRIIGLVASSPDLDRVLDGVVALATEATDCHACFVYLRDGRTLRLRAASAVFARLVDRVEMSIDEGLVGWVARTRTSAYIREDALRDPRFKYVPEIEEERFQSMVAVPVPARSGEAMGVIVLHTEAPREFGEDVLTFLEHTASLVAGAIENGRLYEDARRRVDALTELSGLGQRIAAVTARDELYRTVTEGVRTLLGCEACALRLTGADGRLAVAAVDPPDVDVGDREPGATAVVAAGDERLGALVAVRARPFTAEEDELLHAVANQVAVALARTELIERLTTENLTRELLDALAGDDGELARRRARTAGIELERDYVVVEVRPVAGDERAWPEVAKRVEARLREAAPRAAADLGARRLRALLSVPAERLAAALASLAADEGVAIGRSDALRGSTGGSLALRQAQDACAVAASMRPHGGSLGYEELGAFKYLVRLAPDDAPRDRHAAAVAALVAYDRRRRADLLTTLEEYLRHGRSPTATARALHIHPNTLRQRLERIEQVAGVDAAREDALSLELAVKLERLRGG
jgi:GAF domain-containing protein